MALERDPELARFLAEELLAETPGVEVICQDVLAFDFPGLAREAGRPLAVVGNLPYQITSPLLFTLIRDRAAISQAVLMMQQEVGARLLASPGTKDYGILSVLVTVPFPGDPPLFPVAGEFLSRPPGGFGGAAAGTRRPRPRRPWTRPCCTEWSRPPSATGARP